MTSDDLWIPSSVFRQIKSPSAVEGERATIPSVVPPQFLQTNLEALGSLYRAARTGLLIVGDHEGRPYVLWWTRERRSAVVAEGGFQPVALHLYQPWAAYSSRSQSVMKLRRL